MAETPVPITTGNGSASIAGDLVSGNTYQQIKLVDGTIGGNTPLKVNADGSITASIYGNISVAPAGNQSVSGTVQTQVQASVAVVIIGGSILTSSTANQSVSGTVGASILGNVNTTVTSVATVGGNLPVNIVVGSPGVTAGGGFVSSDNAASVIAVATANYNLVFNGVNWDRQRGNSSVGTLVAPFAYPASFVSGVTSVITGTTSVQVLVPATVGQRNYITNVLVTNAAAVGTVVQLYDAGNVIYSGYAAASGGGFALSFPIPLKQSSVAGNLSALSTVQASVFVSASGYTAP